MAASSIIALVIRCFQIGVYVHCLFFNPYLDKTKINARHCDDVIIVYVAFIKLNSFDCGV